MSRVPRPPLPRQIRTPIAMRLVGLMGLAALAGLVTSVGCLEVSPLVEQSLLEPNHVQRQAVRQWLREHGNSSDIEVVKWHDLVPTVRFYEYQIARRKDDIRMLQDGMFEGGPPRFLEDSIREMSLKLKDAQSSGATFLFVRFREKNAFGAMQLSGRLFVTEGGTAVPASDEIRWYMQRCCAEGADRDLLEASLRVR